MKRVEAMIVDQAAKLRKLAGEKGVLIELDKAEEKASFAKKDKLKRFGLNPNRKTRIIAVTSGKGGVGKTSLSVNLAITLAKMGKKVTVLDADLGLANINVVLGFIPKYTLHHVFKGQKTLAEIIIEVPEGIKIIAGASGFYQLANLEQNQREDLIQSFLNLDMDDIVIIDTGAGVSANVLSFILASDETIVVTTPEPTAITDAYGIIKAIASQTSEMSIKLLVNRVTSVLEGKRVSERVINIAGQFLNSKVENIGFIFDDPIVSYAVRNQKPFASTHPKSKASSCLRTIAATLINSEVSETGGMNNFIQKLFKFLGKDED
jgi:flagellar biosynthesis protein FlhG